MTKQILKKWVIELPYCKYDVNIVKAIGGKQHGQCDFLSRIISIAVGKSVSAHPDFNIIDTFFHEMIHATLAEYGLSRTSKPLVNEEIEETLATILGIALSKNIDTIIDLYKSSKALAKE